MEGSKQAGAALGGSDALRSGSTPGDCMLQLPLLRCSHAERGCGVRLQVVMETIPEGGLSLSEHDALGRTLSKILNSDASCDYLELGGRLAVSGCKRIF